MGPTGNNLAYEFGTTQEFGLFIENTDGAAQNYKITFEGELGEYALFSNAVSELNIYLEENQREHFKFTVMLPEDVTYPPGKNKLYVVGITDSSEYGAVGSLAKLRMGMTLYVPYETKFLELQELTAPRKVEVGETIYLSANVLGLGEIPIERAYGEIDIYHDTELVDDPLIATVPLTEVFSIKKQEEASLLAEWTSERGIHNPGRYLFSAKVYYDDFPDPKEKRASVQLGDVFVDILDVSPKEFPIGTITDGSIEIKSYWLRDLGVSAQISLVNNNGVEVSSSQTSQESLPGLKKGDIPFYLDARNAQVGPHSLKINLSYDGKSTSREIPVELIEPARDIANVAGQAVADSNEKSSGVSIIVVASFFLLLIVVVVLLFLLFKKRREESIESKGDQYQSSTGENDDF
jgi:hypothetical protein